ncbi:MAG: DEAD/DEAH box helicase family protein [Bacteroidota bacterium]|nr:DEAD/DEAH box helicase family protein [Bacteroidota bacterium]
MKLRFEPNLDFQLEAVDSVCDLFRGQEICHSEFTITGAIANGQRPLGLLDEGRGNRLQLTDTEVLANLRDVQTRNGIMPSEELESGDFTVEMETGTGKTYVYLRTIFELNRRFGFVKFVIVVPSIAIKEGVYKTLQITEEHFRALYAGIPFDYFLYDSSKLGEVRSFAASAHIQIMVVTVGAINKKDVNNLYKDSEKTGGSKPVDLIRSTKPVVIVDEPQSVDGGLRGRGRAALTAMEPLCTLRYSATHTDKHHMVYRLDAVDAHERKLVKQIEVAAAIPEDAHNLPYVRLVELNSKRGTVSARVELDVESRAGVRRRIVTLMDGDDLERVTGRVIYRDCRVGEIRVARGSESLELCFPGREEFLSPGQAWGDIDRLAIQREMIRRTIREHLEKERCLKPKAIKVLSLFFIDRVAKYRQYDSDGNPLKGPYATIFEQEYRRLARHPKYASLFDGMDVARVAEEVHGGYFSIDRRSRRVVDTDHGNVAGRAAAQQAYSLVMREKEKLLSLDTPLKFIFSHSALREGWDNPNVFQICTLRDIQTERERRQTIGRGLRLCVNQEGHRIRESGINLLTVVAMESYEDFARNLQREIVKETGIRFGEIASHQFAAVKVINKDGIASTLGIEMSKALWDSLKSRGYIDSAGRIQDALRSALRSHEVELPAEFVQYEGQIIRILRKFTLQIEVRNAAERRQVNIRRSVYQSDDFKALWDRIKQKTTYRVEFSSRDLIERCIRALGRAPTIPRARLQWRKANLSIGRAGVQSEQKEGAQTIALSESGFELPDVLTELQDRTQLTRRTLCRILIGSGRLDDFKRNPQAFIERAAACINRAKHLELANGIRYQRLDDSHIYRQELFEQEDLSGYLSNMLSTTRKSVYKEVVYESETEKRFAEDLERHDAVRLYTKLPGWFTVPTPLGPYNPDWAVLVNRDGIERLYFVVETKGSRYAEDLRPAENAKVICGRAHVGALQGENSSPQYIVARTVEDIFSG